MLEFIMGGAGTGKSTYLEHQIAEIAATGKKVQLLVPDQSTFAAETHLQQILPSASFANVTVFGFQRLCRDVFRNYGGFAGQYADDVTRQTIMHTALCEIKENLTVYGRYAASARFVPKALDMVTELKNADLSPEEFAAKTAEITQPELKRKTQDLALIYATYDAMLTRTFLDPLDDISRAEKLLEGQDYFSGMSVMLDGFSGFTAAQYKVIQRILEQSDDIHITLCYEDEYDDELFREPKRTYQRINHMARGLRAPRITDLSEQHRFQNVSLAHFSSNVLRAGTPVYEGEDVGVQVVKAPNADEEVRFTLATIRDLVENGGLRYRDIAVACRNVEQYLGLFSHAAKTFEIPCFFDAKRSVLHEPPVIFLTALLDAVQKKQTTNAVLRMLRCGLLPYTVEDVAELENYLYLWNIRGEGITRPFYANPSGFASSWSDDDTATLERLEALRQDVVSPILKLRELQNGVGEDFCKALFGAIEAYKLPEALERMYLELSKESRIDAQEFARVYPQIITLLDSLAATLTAPSLTWPHFADLFSLGLSQLDLSERPQCMDAVTFSEISRMRLHQPKVLFLLGVNDGEIPYLPESSSLLTETERSQLLSLSMELGDGMEDRIVSERFAAYCAVSAPSHKLYLLTKRVSFSGEAVQPSELCDAALRMFPNTPEINTETVDSLYYCRTERAAVEEYAHRYHQNTPQISALREELSAHPSLSSSMECLNRGGMTTQFSIADGKIANDLFGKRMRISPSQVELYESCSFSYFCRYGLRVRPRNKAELNPLETGNLIHDLLHSLVAREDFLTLSTKELRKLIEELLQQYVAEYMGGMKGKEARFDYLIRKMERVLLQVAEQLREEFSHSGFRPVAFEQPVGREGSPVGGLELKTKDGSIILCGTIDRVDSFEKDGTTYMRVVDYKSGGKEFKLSELYYGLNMQMLFYLFAIWKEGKGEFANITPAGVLYMPSGYADGSLPRNATEEKIQSEKSKQYRMSGLLLEEPEVLNAMEHGTKGIFIPVKLKKDGSYTSQDSLYTSAQLGRLYTHAMRILRDMYGALHQGEITPLPADNGNRLPCEYCDYQSVCGREDGAPTRVMEKFKKDDFYNQLEQEVQDGNELDN